MTRVELFARAIEARYQLASWGGFDYRGQPVEVRVAAARAREATEELWAVLREQLIEDERDRALEIAWTRRRGEMPRD